MGTNTRAKEAGPRPSPLQQDTAGKAVNVTPVPVAVSPVRHAQPSSSPDMIFREIVQGLYAGNYVPGQRLVETDLTERWGVSRGTVREAFNRLSAEGIIVLSRHRGARIRTLDRSEMQDILAVMEVVIGMAARLAAKHIDVENNRQVFMESFDALQAFRNKPESFELLQARSRFFRTLALVGGNRELQSLLRRMHVHVLRVQLRAMHENFVTEHFDDYTAIADAVLAGETRRAELITRRHIRATGAVLNQAPRQITDV